MRCSAFVISVLLLILSNTNSAQKSQQADKIEYYKSACKKYIDAENYMELISSAKQGLDVATATKSNESISLFSYYLGTGYDDKGKYDSAIYFQQLSEKTACLIHSAKRFTAAQSALADDYYTIGLHDSVSAYQKKMLFEIDTLKDDSLKMNLYKSVIGIYIENNEYEKAATGYINLLRYSEKHNDKRATGVVLVNLGNLYLQMSNSAKALPYLLHAMPYLSDYDYGQIICADNIGVAYTDLKLYDSAIQYHTLAINIAKKIKDTGDVYAAYEKLSAALIGKKEFTQAAQYLKPALQYALSTNTATEIIDGENFSGEVAFGKKDYKTALIFFLNALQSAQKTNHTERENELYKWIAQTADSTHAYQLATAYYSKYILLNDSLTKESSKKTIAELETQYQTQQKEQQIKLLNQQSKTQILELKNQKNKTWFLLAGFLFTATLITLFIRYRYRLNQLKKLTEVRNSISRDLHDEIGATLSSINIYSEVAKNKLEENPEVQLLLQRIHDGSAQMMDGMSDIVWYVNPKNDNAENTIIKMREYAAPVLEAKQVNLHFITDEQTKNIKLSMLQRQNLYLLFKEAINNTAKYAVAKNTYVDIKMIGKQAYLKIKDDGKGFNLNDHINGNGLNNMQQRAQFLKGTCVIKTEAGNGTCIEVNFPVSL